MNWTIEQVENYIDHYYQLKEYELKFWQETYISNFYTGEIAIRAKGLATQPHSFRRLRKT